MEIPRQRQHQRDLHHFGGLQLKRADRDPALRPHADNAAQIDRDNQQQRRRINPICGAKPVRHVDKRDREHGDQHDPEADHLPRRPGLKLAIRSRIQHREPDRGDQPEQQQQPPLNAAKFVGKRQFATPDAEIGHSALPPAEVVRSGRPPVDHALGHRLWLRHPARRIAALRFEQHIAADRRRHRRPAAGIHAAMLDHGGADVTRRLDRRKGDEQRMVALPPRNLRRLADPVIVLPLRDLAHLRGARLAAHRIGRIGNARRVCGAALLVDDCVHPVEHERAVARIDAQGSKGRHRFVAARRQLAVAHQTRHDGPAGYEPRGHRRQLQRGGEHRALTYPGDQRLASRTTHRQRFAVSTRGSGSTRRALRGFRGRADGRSRSGAPSRQDARCRAAAPSRKRTRRRTA